MTRTAVVTGAASGIGRAMAELLIEDGYQVLINDINVQRLDEASAELGPNAFPFTGNLAKLETIDRLIEKAFKQFEDVGLVFANAGVSDPAPLLSATPEQFALNFKINTRAPWLIARGFAKRWIETGKNGRICITGSEHSLGYQHSGNGLYTGSKQAVLGIAEVLRHELPETISVSVLCPGLVSTGLFDHSHVPGVQTPSPHGLEFSRAVMAEGMAPKTVARKAIDGTLQGEPLIVTHAVARDGAKTRWEDVDKAFSEQAPPDAHGEMYRVTSVVERVKAEYRLRKK